MKFSNEEFLKGRKVLEKRDKDLKTLLRRHAIVFKPESARSPFESLVRAIAHQQLHGKAAQTILNRMLDLFPHAKFPKPEEIIALQAEKLRACGFSASKVKSIRDIAEKTLNGVVPTSRQIRKLSNEEITERLTSIFGVGKWTVEMLLIFQLGRLDIWPVDDFGVRKGYQIWKKKRNFPTAKDLKGKGEEFAPYQTIVSLYLWREADMAKLKK